MKLVSVGEATADFYPQLNQTFAGGISLNFAVQAKRCGAKQVSLVSCVGKDAAGQLVRQKLAAEQIDATHLAVLPGRTGHCEIVVLPDGERHFPPNSYHQHLLADYLPSTADLAFIQQHDLLAARFDISYTKAAFDLVMRELPFSGRKVADFGDWADYAGREEMIWPYLPHLDLAFMSGDEDAVTAVLSYTTGRTLWVVTLGAKGSVALPHGQPIWQTAVSVPQIIDTTGCGDAFQAAFTVSYFKTGDMGQALEAGAKQAALTIQHYGAT